MTSYKCVCIAFFTLFIHHACYAKTFNVKNFGAVGDGKTDNYVAIHKAIKAINSEQGGTLIFPKGVYYIAKYHSQDPNKDTIQDFIFKNCKNLTIEGNQSTLIVNGNFRRNLDFAPTNESFSRTVIPFYIENCSHVIIRNFELAGGVQNMTRDSLVKEGGGDGIFIGANSRDITLKNIFAHHFQRDGILLHDIGDNICLINIKSYNNARQGLTIGGGHNIKCRNSDFSYTGHTDGKYAPHAPIAGVDIEEVVSLSDVLFDKCRFTKNLGFQIVATGSKDSKNITVQNSYIEDNNAGYGHYLNGVGLFVHNSVLKNSTIYGMTVLGIADTRADSTNLFTLKNNKIYSGNTALLSQTFPRQAIIDNNTFYMLPKFAIAPPQWFINIANPFVSFTNNKIFFDETMAIDTARNLRTVCLLYGCRNIANNTWRFKNLKRPNNTATYATVYSSQEKFKNEHFFDGIIGGY
jgi:Pectate lyase superfamily protein/Right handed beta helix region